MSPCSPASGAHDGEAAGRTGQDLLAEAAAWAASDPDPETRAEVEALVAARDLAALGERFDEPLDFGTAGIRGQLGAGPARMNRAVVRRIAAGLARFVRGTGDDAARRGIVVGHDARHGSTVFAADLAEVAARAGVRARSFSRPLPTPITAFAVRHLGAAAGAMVTASHNPARDNGVKVYLGDGAQVIPPFDAEIAAAAHLDGARLDRGRLDEPGEAHRGPSATAGPVDEEEVLAAYRDTVCSLLDPVSPRSLAVVYTPLHGVGGAVVPDLLVRAGFAPPAVVPEQADPDPDFPTLSFPNPEEPGALDLAIAHARRVGADLVVANDPDADRLAVAVPDATGRRWRALGGDELGILIADHLLATTSGPDRLVATTIVSSTMLAALAREQGVAYVETLTGFKWIARAAARRPGHRLVFGYEEALGYAVTDAVADKDGMSAALVVASLAARAKSSGATLPDLLDGLSCRLGVHESAQLSLRLDGPGATAAIAEVVARWRDDPPRRLAGLEVTDAVDLAEGSDELPPTDGVVLRSGDRLRVVVRPSGTEPKLKAYLLVTTPPVRPAELAGARREASALLGALRREVGRRFER